MSSAAFSPDGKRIVTASEDKTARIWDAATGKQIGEPLKGHDGRCRARRSAPTASASSPRLKTRRRGCGTRRPGKPIGQPLAGHEETVWSAAFSPDGKRIVTASQRTRRRRSGTFAGLQELDCESRRRPSRAASPPSNAKRSSCLPSRRAWCIEMEKWPYRTSEWKQWLAEPRRQEPPLPRRLLSNSALSGNARNLPSRRCLGLRSMHTLGGKAISRPQWKDGYGAESGPCRGGPGRGALRPIEAFKARVRYGRSTS